MKQNFKIDPWHIIEEKFVPENNRFSESIFTVGNGNLEMHGNFEECFTGNTQSGFYISGIYVPYEPHDDITANQMHKYLNAPSWIGIKLKIGDLWLDLAKNKTLEFKRNLNMQDGYFERTFVAEIDDGKKIKIDILRFISMVDNEIGAIRFVITPLNFSNKATITIDINANVENEQNIADEKRWVEVEKTVSSDEMHLTTATKKTFYHVCTAVDYQIIQEHAIIKPELLETIDREKHIGHKISLTLNEGKTVAIYKFATILSSLNHAKADLIGIALNKLNSCKSAGFEKLLNNHKKAWTDFWNINDVIIDGDEQAQQNVRYAIFQLRQHFSFIINGVDVNNENFFQAITSNFSTVVQPKKNKPIKYCNSDDELQFVNLYEFWQNIIFGYAGLELKDNFISLKPSIPKSWNKLSFNIFHQNCLLTLKIDNKIISIKNESTQTINIKIFEDELVIHAKSTIKHTINI